MTTLSDIEKLAAKTAQEALKEDTPLEARIDALKSLTPYYTALKKAAGNDPIASDEPTMDDLRVGVTDSDKETVRGRTVQAGTRRRN